MIPHLMDERERSIDHPLPLVPKRSVHRWILFVHTMYLLALIFVSVALLSAAMSLRDATARLDAHRDGEVKRDAEATRASDAARSRYVEQQSTLITQQKTLKELQEANRALAERLNRQLRGNP